jgi:hypothetical protein
LAQTDKAAYLQDILDRILPRNGSSQEKIETIVRFVQDATWHNPLECPFEEDGKTMVTEAHVLLELHDTRCWHSAELLRQLFHQGGWDAKITVLPYKYCPSVHVITEVLYDGLWHFTDADYFKNGVIVRKPDGGIPSLEWLQEYPRYIERFPGGWIFPPEYLTNMDGATVTGQFSLAFPEAVNTWGCDPYYGFYLGEMERFPPIQPPGVTVKAQGSDCCKISWGKSRGKTSQFIRYNLAVSRLNDGAAVRELKDLDGTDAFIDGLALNETYCAAVCATDEHALIEPDTWYPSTVVSFTPTDRIDSNC